MTSARPVLEDTVMSWATMDGGSLFERILLERSLFKRGLFERDSYQLMVGTAALGLAGKPGKENPPVSGEG
jgi:hypothetical protein